MTVRSAPEGLERALLWLVSGYRVFGAAWMVLLGSVVLASSDRPKHPGWVIGALVVVVAWTLTTVGIALQAPHVATSWVFVIVDVAVGVFSVWSSVPAGTILFAGGFPLAPAFAAVYAKGTAGGVLAALALTVAAVGRLPGRPSFDQPNSVSIVISYLFSTAAASGAASVLRSSDRRRAEAEEALAVEQAARARADERAEVAAHLHDSVLQTLALIQRDTAATDGIRGLARRQERDLRSWLFPGEAAEPAGFRDAVTALGAEVDHMFDAHVECVIVGDGPMDDDLAALIGAGREAAINAAKHSGASSLSVYAELGDTDALLFVKDRGTGFDPDAVPADRRGIAESILGRMERHGGTAVIDSVAGRGTEVRLRLPRGGSEHE